MWRRRTVLAGIAAGFAVPALAQDVTADDKRLRIATVHQRVGPDRILTLYMALPAKAHGRQPAVMIAHDTAGLDDYTRDVARRIALAGYVACAPDFLSRQGGTPADPAAARAAIMALDPDQTVHDAVGVVRWLGINPPGEQVLTGKVGALGYGWGGALVDRTALAAATLLTAAVSDAPAPTLQPAAATFRPPAGDPARGWDQTIAFFRERLT